MHYSKVTKICIILAVLFFAGHKCFIHLAQNSCLDDGNVWDYNENRCREDCLAWNKINGCIKLTEEQIKLFKKCRHQSAGCVAEEIFHEICLSNNLPLNTRTGECDVEFTPNKCHQLGKNWIYPKICENKH